MLLNNTYIVCQKKNQKKKKKWKQKSLHGFLSKSILILENKGLALAISKKYTFFHIIDR